MNTPNPTGSRGYHFVNFIGTCNISGLDVSQPAAKFVKSKTILLREDFVDYTYEYLSFKFGLTQNSGAIALKWFNDEWVEPNDMVYGDLNYDFRNTAKILNFFQKNFQKSKNEPKNSDY